MAFCSCFGPSKAQRREEERIESEEARAKAAEAAQRREEEFKKSAAGRAARAQMAAAAKQSNTPSKGEPVLKDGLDCVAQFSPDQSRLWRHSE